MVDGIGDTNLYRIIDGLTERLTRTETKAEEMRVSQDNARHALADRHAARIQVIEETQSRNAEDIGMLKANVSIVTMVIDRHATMSEKYGRLDERQRIFDENLRKLQDAGSRGAWLLLDKALTFLIGLAVGLAGYFLKR